VHSKEQAKHSAPRPRSFDKGHGHADIVGGRAAPGGPEHGEGTTGSKGGKGQAAKEPREATTDPEPADPKRAGNRPRFDRDR
jgi:hypothetical protein